MTTLAVARLVRISERHEKQKLPRRKQPRKARESLAFLGEVQNVHDGTYVGAGGCQRSECRA